MEKHEKMAVYHGKKRKMLVLKRENMFVHGKW